MDGLPVLAGQDLAARKVLAILDRVEGRDFTDLRALADRHSQTKTIEWAGLDEGGRQSARHRSRLRSNPEVWAEVARFLRRSSR